MCSLCCAVLCFVVLCYGLMFAGPFVFIWYRCFPSTFLRLTRIDITFVFVYGSFSHSLIYQWTTLCLWDLKLSLLEALKARLITILYSFLFNLIFYFKPCVRHSFDSSHRQPSNYKLIFFFRKVWGLTLQ